MEAKNIAIEDLRYLEKDLTREELISVVFLLFGAEKPQWALEKLEKKDSKSSSNNCWLLEEFAKSHDNWKSLIIEALGVAQVFECIKKLGVPVAEARNFARTSALINPGLRLLYELCESLMTDISDQLSAFIKSRCNSTTIAESTEQLEIFLLLAITDGKIKISTTLDACDFSLIHHFKNSAGVDDKPVLDILEKFPSRPNRLDNSNSSNFNNSSETGAQASENGRVEGPIASGLLESYCTKKMLVLIINQQTFTRTTNIELLKLLPDHDLSERKGTIKDKEALQSLFEGFNYHVLTRDNLSHVETLREVDKTTKQSSKFDGLIVCILSHGHEGIVYGSDSVPVLVKDIKETMSSKVLLDKPKILLIQACQGSNLQRSVKKIVSRTELDGPSQSMLISGSTRADFLIFWSTIEGFASIRHIDLGSWFIQELVKKIRESCKSQNLLDICTAVIKEVSLKRGYKDECMLPKLESTFTRNFRFP